jgi:hypothetical protein
MTLSAMESSAAPHLEGDAADLKKSIQGHGTETSMSHVWLGQDPGKRLDARGSWRGNPTTKSAGFGFPQRDFYGCVKMHSACYVCVNLHSAQGGA